MDSGIISSTTSGGWTEGDIDVDGVGVHFHRAGTRAKPALVLAHGLSDSGRCWARVAAALGEHFDIVMPDARNHGQSDTAATSPDRLAGDVEALIIALGLRRPTLMGHSLGAHTMALCAARRPELVSKLVLEDPPWAASHEHRVDTSSAARRDEVRAWLGSFVHLSYDEIAAAGRRQHGNWHDVEIPAWVESNRQVRVKAADGLTFDAWGTTASNLSCPTLLVHGEDALGGLVTGAVATRVAELNPHITCTLIDRAGHNVRRENFERYIDVVTRFLRNEQPS